MTDYGPSIKVCKVYEKTSKAGNTYFTGRWGSAHINILKSRETADDGTPIWEVLLQEAPPAAQNVEPRRTRREKAEAPAQAQEPCRPSTPDDAIPF